MGVLHRIDYTKRYLRFRKTWWLLVSFFILTLLESCFFNKKNEKTYCQEVYVYNHVTNEPIAGALIFHQSFSGSGFIQKAEIDTFVTDATGIALVQSNQPVTKNSIGYVMPDINYRAKHYADSCGNVFPIKEQNDRLEIPMELLQFLVIHVEVDTSDYPDDISMSVDTWSTKCTAPFTFCERIYLGKNGIRNHIEIKNNTIVIGAPRSKLDYVLHYCPNIYCSNCRSSPTYSINIPRTADTVHYHFTPKSK